MPGSISRGHWSAADQDPVRLRKQFGRSLRLWGVSTNVFSPGVPRPSMLTCSRAGSAGRRGRYIPIIDHTVPTGRKLGQLPALYGTEGQATSRCTIEAWRTHKAGSAHNSRPIRPRDDRKASPGRFQRRYSSTCPSAEGLPGSAGECRSQSRYLLQPRTTPGGGASRQSRRASSQFASPSPITASGPAP